MPSATDGVYKARSLRSAFPPFHYHQFGFGPRCPWRIVGNQALVASDALVLAPSCEKQPRMLLLQFPKQLAPGSSRGHTVVWTRTRAENPFQSGFTRRCETSFL